MLKVLDRLGSNYRLVSSSGEIFETSAQLLKYEMAKNPNLVINAKLSKTGRLTIDKNCKTQLKQMGYERNPNLIGADSRVKFNYYWEVIVENNVRLCLSSYTIDDLDSILCGSLSLEIQDYGNSNVDIMLQKNIRCFPTIGLVIDECIRRKYLTEDEIRQYLLGCNKAGRICNVYSFVDWILLHKRY